MTTLKISDSVSLDLLRLIDSRMLIQANSGGGKSWLLRLIAEQAAGHTQTIILDPEGEFATLREKHDFLLAGQGGEIPADPRSAGLLARRLVELQASAVIDLYDLRLPDRRRFVRLFLESLMHLPKAAWHPLLVMLDESHLFCPERSAGEAESTAAVIDLMSQGRKRSYCGILATQRLSKLHKDAEAETNNVVIGRTWLDLDQKRAGSLLGMSGADDRLTLRDLGPGEFFAFGPALSDQGVVRFRAGPVQTTHPKAGQRHKLTPPKPSEAVRRIVADLADLPQQAEAEVLDLANARRRIADLERQLRERPAATVEVERVVEVPVLKNGQLDRTEKVAERFDGIASRVTAELAELRRLIAPAAAPRVVHPADRQRPMYHPPPKPQKLPPPAGGTHSGTARPNVPDANGDDSLSGPERRILDALAWMESIGVAEPEQPAVAFLAGYTVGGGAWNNPRGRLRTRGLIDYRPGDRLALTAAGRALATCPDTPLTGDELRRRVLDRLPGPERKILTVLIDAYPNDVAMPDLAAAAGYADGGGAFNNPRGRLRTFGLISYPAPGRAVALPLLFPEDT